MYSVRFRRESIFKLSLCVVGIGFSFIVYRLPIYTILRVVIGAGAGAGGVAATATTTTTTTNTTVVLIQ